MKGPHGRGKFDVRRVWECPRCHRREFTSGQVVQRACGCSGSVDISTWMCVVEENRKIAVPPPEDLPRGADS